MMESIDSADWNNTSTPFLAKLENTMRCNICKEVYTAPMITACCHTFCSLCIRRLLQTDTSCPICRQSVQSGMLRKNQALDDLLEEYVNIRGHLLDVSQQKEHSKADPIVEGDSIPSSQSSEPDLRRSKRRKTSTNYGEMDLKSFQDDIPSSDGPYKESSLKSTASSKPGEPYGECPVCGKYLKVKEIESTHIASCLSSQSSPARSSSIMSFMKPAKSHLDLTKKLPVRNYSIMKQTDIKKLLQDAGLCSTGGRHLMEQRHREWVTLWNSNADLKAPQHKDKLMKLLHAWEATLKADEKAAENAGTMDIKKIDGKQWSITHHDEFADLIATARKNVKKGDGQVPNAAAGVSCNANSTLPTKSEG